jgi:hypothetical protein
MEINVNIKMFGKLSTDEIIVQDMEAVLLQIQVVNSQYAMENQSIIQHNI